MQDSSQAENAVEKDINDVFTDIVFSEDRLIKRGYTEGFTVGTSSDNLEAFHLGYHRGAELGAEIGYYTSTVDYYLKHFEEEQLGSEKVRNNLTSLKVLLSTFPHHNSTDIDIVELTGAIRAKFKKLCACLKIDSSFAKTSQLSF